jgi:hypothetical protein
MRAVDRVFYVLALPLGLLLLILGGLGLFSGCHASFRLPPVFGVAPALVGWGIVRAIFVAWRTPRPPSAKQIGHVFE